LQIIKFKLWKNPILRLEHGGFGPYPTPHMSTHLIKLGGEENSTSWTLIPVN